MLSELVPNVTSESYHFALQLRHEKSDRHGFVGFYFTDQLFEEGDYKIHFPLLLTFNDVVDMRELSLAMGFQKPARNYVRFYPFLYRMDGAQPRGSASLSGVAGPSNT